MKTSPELATWIALNEALMGGDLALAERLLREEGKGKRRKMFLLRLHSRINRLRAANERAALMKKVL
jgi:hypothetical protein